MRGALASVAITISAAIVPAVVQAQTRADFGVSARIVNGCAVALDAGGVVGRIDFGTLPGTASQSVEADLLSGGGTGIAIECTPGATASVSADMGDHASGGERRMGSGTNHIAYRLVLGSGPGEWGTQPVTLSFPAGGSAQRLALKGRAMLTGAHAAGRYSDTVRVTVSW
jgi:spore coat protein U-like protein